jgi:hypothetical protein
MVVVTVADHHTIQIRGIEAQHIQIVRQHLSTLPRVEEYVADRGRQPHSQTVFAEKVAVRPGLVVHYARYRQISHGSSAPHI